MSLDTLEIDSDASTEVFKLFVETFLIPRSVIYLTDQICHLRVKLRVRASIPWTKVLSLTPSVVTAVLALAVADSATSVVDRCVVAAFALGRELVV